jgi:hypothetical protein
LILNDSPEFFAFFFGKKTKALERLFGSRAAED